MKGIKPIISFFIGSIIANKLSFIFLSITMDEKSKNINNSLTTSYINVYCYNEQTQISKKLNNLYTNFIISF